MAETSKPTRQLRLDSESASELECPVCLEYAIPPIVLCKIGHIVCGICRKGVERCAICREAYTDTRNYAIENIVSKIKVKCRYKSCQEIHSVVKLEEHLKNCDYRPVVCNYTSVTRCNNKLIEFDQFVEHLTTVHEYAKQSLEKLSYKMISAALDPTCIAGFYHEDGSLKIYLEPKICIHKGVHFILHAVENESIVYFWVSAMLTKAEALNYFVDFRIGQLLDEKIDLERRNIQWTTGVSSVHKTLQDVEKAGDCVALTKASLVPLLEFIPGDEDRDEFFFFFVEFQIRKK